MSPNPLTDALFSMIARRAEYATLHGGDMPGVNAELFDAVVLSFAMPCDSDGADAGIVDIRRRTKMVFCVAILLEELERVYQIPESSDQVPLSAPVPA